MALTPGVHSLWGDGVAGICLAMVLGLTLAFRLPGAIFKDKIHAPGKPSYENLFLALDGPAWEDLPHDSRGPSILATVWITLGLAAIFVGLRFWTRIKIVRMVGTADWLILASIITAGAMCSVMTVEVSYGMGKHVWDVEPPENFAKMLKTWYFALLFYCLSLGFSKMSICVIYVTIFTYEWAKKCSWAMLIFVIIHNLWALSTTLTFCIPLQSVWDDTVKASYCHPQAVWWANTSLVIVTDFLIFLLPIPMIMPLKLPRRQKIAVLAVFAVGFFICIVSVVRLIVVIQLKSSTDLDYTYNNAMSNHWTALEIHVSIIVACAMTLKPFITHLFPNLLEPQSGENTAERSGGAGSSGGLQLTIGSKPLRNQPMPIHPGAGDWLEVVAEEGGSLRTNDNNKDNNVIEDVALRDIDIEAQTHQHHQPRPSNAAKAKRENKKLGSNNHRTRGSVVEDLPEFLRPASRPYARGDAASVSTQASLGPEVTARSMG
ncbi:hypothetical protein QBC36DRAFT_340707 [Triangularia setosa]|uniref:Rhodopsin domain-containing protein n=1 Tax=Triangularia setosa TaxID=2587417 RepID=A0AAN7A3I6_9PEZI|nr:hypothetical protein QBC36DRAFT_340707 [Podospora setosa]